MKRKKETTISVRTKTGMVFTSFPELCVFRLNFNPASRIVTEDRKIEVLITDIEIQKELAYGKLIGYYAYGFNEIENVIPLHNPFQGENPLRKSDSGNNLTESEFLKTVKNRITAKQLAALEGFFPGITEKYNAL